MDCEAVRDRFSSLWERELSPSEKKVVEEHLSSCPKCRSEFEKFGKTMRWLRSVEEVEVPEGFLADLHKKMEGRKGNFPGKKPGARGFSFPLSFKLPAQAVAMVAVVFFVLYVTKMIPIDGHRLRDAKEASSTLSADKRSEAISAQNRADKEQRALDTPAKILRPEEVQLAEAPKEGKLEEAPAPHVRAEAKKGEAPAPSTEAMEYQKVGSKEAARVTPPPPGRIEGGLDHKEKSVAALKPPPEITLKISDRGNMIARLHELVEQFGGDVIGVEGNIVLASLPTASISEFEKELAGLSSSGKADFPAAKKQGAGSLRFETGMKKEVDREKNKERARLAPDSEDRSTVRIRLIQE